MKVGVDAKAKFGHNVVIRAITVGAVRGAVLATGTFAAVTTLIVRRGRTQLAEKGLRR